jgi:hypothetical protein
MQVKAEAAEALGQLGLRINRMKTKVLRANTTLDATLNTDEGIEEVGHFTYLGSIVDEQGGKEAAFKTKIRKIRATQKYWCLEGNGN